MLIFASALIYLTYILQNSSVANVFVPLPKVTAQDNHQRLLSTTEAWILTLEKQNCSPGFGSMKRMIYNKTYGLCTTEDGKFIIWVFWDYTPMPAYVNLSIEALKCHNQAFAHVEIVNDKTFRRFANEANFPLHPAFDGMIEAHKADYFRCLILLKYGGFYTDADMVHWNSLWPWFQKLAEGYDIYGYTWPGEIIGITLLGPMRQNNALMQYWLQDAHHLLDAKLSAFRFRKFVDYPLGWAEMLRNILQPRMHQLLGESKIKYFSFDGPSNMGLMQNEALELFKPYRSNSSDQTRGLEALRKSNFSIFVYHHSPQPGDVKAMKNVDAFIKTDFVFVRVTNMTMERCQTFRKAGTIQ